VRRAQLLDRSLTWRAALTVSAGPRVIAGMSLAGFTGAVRGQLPAVGASGSASGIAAAVHAAAASPGGIEAEQDALAERADFACAGWLTALAEVQRVEARMVQIPGELHLTQLVITIPGISAVGAAAILAETGDPARYDDPRAWAGTPSWPRGPTSRAPPAALPAPPAGAGPGCAPICEPPEYCGWAVRNM
jgi:transposase